MTEPFDLIRSRRRTIALIVQTDGRLVVRAPLRAPEKMIRDFVETKADWIRKKQAQARTEHLPPRQFAEGERFLYVGKPYPLKFVPPQRPALQLGNAFRLSRSARPRAKAAFIRWYKARAVEVIGGRVDRFARQCGFAYERIRITSARARWGSCSSRGTLSFTYRLVMAPLEIIDYVVVHELVHLKVKNHSKRFWSQVAAILPEYKRHIAWLRRNGRALTLE
jgi:predicted metal-dependent hydrolase